MSDRIKRRGTRDARRASLSTLVFTVYRNRYAIFIATLYRNRYAIFLCPYW